MPSKSGETETGYRSRQSQIVAAKRDGTDTQDGGEQPDDSY